MFRSKQEGQKESLYKISYFYSKTWKIWTDKKLIGMAEKPAVIQGKTS